MQLLLETRALTLRTRNAAFLVEGEGKANIISPHRVSSIIVGASCLISTSAVLLALEHQIPMVLAGITGKPEARLCSPRLKGIGTLRRNQAQAASLTSISGWLVENLQVKTQRQARLLSKYFKNHADKQLAQLAIETAAALSAAIPSLEPFLAGSPEQYRNEMMGWEGARSRAYWQAVGKLMPPMYQFGHRSRQPATDPFNCLLNYIYGMLYVQVERAVVSVGLDPCMGFLHVDGYDRPSLVFDAIEPFRPWADQFVLELCVSMTFDARVHTDPYQENEVVGMKLNKAGKKVVVPLFQAWLKQRPEPAEKLSRNGCIYRAAQLLARQLKGGEDARVD